MGGHTPQDDPRHAVVLKAVQDDGRWTEAQERNITAHLYLAVSDDPLMKQVDQVVISGDGVEDARIYAIHKPNGDQQPMYVAHVDAGVRDTAVPPPAPAGDAGGYLTEPGIVRKSIPALEHGTLGGIDAIVLHRTEGATAQSAFNAFESGTGTHFLIDKDGTIYQTASLDQKTHHVGKIKSRCMEEGTCSAEEKQTIEDMGWAPARLNAHEAAKPYPERFPNSSDSVGIEVVGRYNEATKTWDEPTEAQKASIARLVGVLQNTYGLHNDDVYAHDKISYKTPGEGQGLWQPPAAVLDAPGLQPEVRQR